MSAVLDSRTFYDGALTYTVEVSTDHDASPSDVDHYSDADLDAYRRGAWQYVIVTVTAELTFTDGQTADEMELDDTMSAVEFGDLGGKPITLDWLIAEQPVPEMIDGLKQRYRSLHERLRQLAESGALGAIAADGTVESPATPQDGSGDMPPIRYTGVVQDGTDFDDLIPRVNVFGHTEDEVYQGIFNTIATWITAGELHDTPQWWLDEHPIAGVRVTEPGAAQEWLEGFRQHATYPYWTVLEHESLLDMRQPPGHGN